MRYYLHLKIAGRPIPDPHGFEAETEDAAIDRARSHFVDLGRSGFRSRLSVELEDERGRSILILFANSEQDAIDAQYLS